MNTNFSFLENEWSSMYQKMLKAEARIKTEPISAANYCRLVLEECIYHLYDIEYIELPYNTKLANLVSQEEIKRIIPYNHRNGLRFVRLTGNAASHYGQKVKSKDALTSIRYLFEFLKWFANNYSEATPILPGLFDESVIPKVGAAQRKFKELEKERAKEAADLQSQIEQLQAANAAMLAKAKENDLALIQYQQKVAEDKAALEVKKKERYIIIPAEYTESQTRTNIIDISLKEAGWSVLRNGREIEYPVQGMPITKDNPKGNGFVDYVLWDDNGKPLALIEAKRTSRNVEAGKHQAFLYANCLEKMHGQRPIIFYTNGYETRIWEDQFYSTPREIHGFYTKEELQWLLQRNDTREDIRQASVDVEIAGRPYQIEAIQRVAESLVIDSPMGLKGDKRNVLLVMATGSGKTRTAAALVDILFQHNWVKRVLFLADRNALVTQAQKRFGEFLTDLSSIDLTQEKENNTTRLVFSTYPSIMNKIDKGQEEGATFYGVGHFDLIIVDEAHRSVYNRYKAIFDYFDALVVGLTATPKDSIDHNTFELFGCSDDDPTFSYELEEAVESGFLNPYQNIDVSTHFLREGIKYHQLSDKEKEQYEATFSDATTGLFPEEIQANAMNKWLFNKDTVNKVLDALMERGLKIEGGDKIGRTIIFAVNQKHSNFIVKCFTERYPDKPAGFISTIHNKVSHAQSLIDAFCDEFKENNPQIAVSVDMMDTGIDAPRVLNLVFFKVVRSYAKFWQMIGRGTRLCPDVYGPEQEKTEFLIFDVCQNFEFFNIHKKGRTSGNPKPIAQQTFEARLQLSRLLAETGEEENLALATALLDKLHDSIAALNADRFQVKMNRRYVDEFSSRDRWNNLSSEDVHLIETHLSALPIPETIHETARRFDLMMLKLQIANLLSLSQEQGYQENLITIATQLGEKYTITPVLAAKPLIESLKDPDFYKKLTQLRLEEIRTEIRDLVKYLDKQSRTPIYTNLQDSEVIMTASEPLIPHSGHIYKKRVESFIRENKHQLTIAKLSTNQPITTDELQQLETILFDGEERGKKEDFIKVYGEQPLGAFVRSIIGLDTQAAQQAFADFLQVGNLSADQMTFINTIINYLSKNGIIDKELLFQSPFTDMHDQGVFGLFDEVESGKIIRIIDGINENAGVA